MPYKDRQKKIEHDRAYRLSKKEIQIPQILKDIGKKFSDKELQAISKGSGMGLQARPGIKIDFAGEELTIGFITDTHIGSVYYKPEFLTAAFEIFTKHNVKMILHAGDLSEGMSNRPGHVYELTHIGYTAQKNYCIEQLKPWKKLIYLIDGNHDRFFLKSSGAYIVKDVCEALPNATFLGNDEGDLYVEKIWIKMFHGEDGSAYSRGYRAQKIIESFTGGEKPNVLLLGHDHKQMYMQERNIQTISGGCLSLQSRWMRSKRMAAHTGFWILKMIIGSKGIVSFSPTWYPFYQ